uniref:uncharacterized protein C1orf141 homolog n=1 Tax=Jaculus jaculus TaxID=51337 RepID=UPI000332FFA2|nr:uncharacterized protein C1orf141 homolog [Jaculus jaculus]
MNDFNSKENKLIRNYQLSEHCPVRKDRLLPLCLEDELRAPNAKIINIVPAKAGTSPVKQQDTKPIIFHDTRYILMWLLRKCRFIPHLFTYKRKNFVLERNCAIFKSLISDQPRTLSKPKRTLMPAAWRKDIQTMLCERIHRTVKDKVKKATVQNSEKRPWSRLYTLSHSLSSLAKNFESYFDKTIIQEKRTNPGESGRMFLMVKPRNAPKFCVLPVKCCPKPLKNILEVRKLNNVTPLDNLLNLPGEMK